MSSVPPMSDALLTLSEGQVSALAALAQCGGDHEARSSVTNWIRSWDKALNRGDTIALRDRITRARKVWDGQLFIDGAGI